MAKNLVIVESPAKAKTIEGYLGKDFLVKSSYGHVRDLPKNNNSIDITNGFKPNYEISADKKAVVSELKKLAKDSEIVWLATDDDREGEAISWHLKEALNLKDRDTKRIVFREITKPAILKAIENPRGIDYDLVNAQQARRVLDRLVGFEISPILWKKIKGGLSAGRVQSVAVRLIVEREREVERFESQSSFRVRGNFDAGKGKNLVAELNEKFSSEDLTAEFLNNCQGASFKIESLEVKPGKRTPAPPFTTSTLQQEASSRLGYSVSQTMVLAQKLYEAGHISYMRTDSFNLSQQAIDGAKKEINAAYGNNYIKERHYKTKSESAQEAHEAIRPTDFSKHSVGDDKDQRRLYELIWKRAIASQMADAELERTIATIEISNNAKAKFVATGEVIKFDGFLKVYLDSDAEDTEEEGENNKLLPPLEVGQNLPLYSIIGTERFSKHPPRYTEASLVRKLEEMGIGRPSTYAPTISTIINRQYVVKESRDGHTRNFVEFQLTPNQGIERRVKSEITGAEKNKLFPTDMGTIVTDFLVNHFHSIIDYSFTAEVEKEFDEIAHGKVEWPEMIDKFYKNFHAAVEQGETIDRASSGTSRELGFHPETGAKVFVRLARYGPVVQIGETTETEKPVFASLKKDQRLETITIQEALELFKLPRDIGEFEGKKISAAIGRFGPYIKHDNKFVSLPKGVDPLEINLDQAIELINAKRVEEANRVISVFENDPEVKVLNGRFGPYIQYHGANVKIPKGTDAKTLNYEDCKKLALESGADKPSGKFKGRSSAATKEVKEKSATSKPKKAATPKTTTRKAKKNDA